MAAQTPAKAAREEKGVEPSFSAKLNDFLRANRVAFVAAFAAIIVVVLGAAAWTVWKGYADSRAALALESAEASFQAWQAESDAARKSALEASLAEELAALGRRYGQSYAGLSASTLEARLAEAAERWADAERIYADVARRAPPASHLASSSLRRAAFAAERGGANDRAQALWTEFVDRFEGKAPGVERARLALLRLAEAGKDYAAAKAQHDVLVSRYPASDWTKLARDRILYLESQGLLK